MDVVPKNAFRAVSTFSKRPPPAPVAKLILENHVGSDGNFTIHMGFVLAGVLGMDVSMFHWTTSKKGIFHSHPLQ